MIPTARTIFSALEFRKPMMLRNVEPLSEKQMLWRPGPQRVSIAWQLWHIAEVEDNWIRALVTNEPMRHPFGVAQREADDEQYPAKADLLAYFHEVRAITRKRPKAADEADFDRQVHDDDFGELTVTFKDGSEEKACTGDMFYWPPYHTVRADKDSEFVLFSPQHEHGAVMEHVKGKLGG